MVLTSIDQRVDNARKKDKFLCFLGDVFASEDVGVRGKDASCCTDSLFNVVVVIAVGCQPRAEVLLFVDKRDFAVGVRGVADRDTVDVDRWRQRQLSWIFYVGCSKPHADTL